MSRFAISNQTPPTPFYHYDLQLLSDTLQTALTQAAKYGYNLHYALKANVDARLLSIISQIGFGADCVSGWEVESALDNGFKANQIVFAGVGKSDNEIRYALQNDIFCFNCESLQELEVINSIADQMGKVATIALRINPNVEPSTHKFISTGHGESKFGIAYTEVEQALAKLELLPNLKIVGLHFHIGSQITELDFFEDLAKKAAAICLWFESRGLDIEHLNMGGGLGVDYHDPDKNQIADFAGYFERFARHLPTNKTVHFELGRSIVAQCGELITRVLYTKKTISGANYAILDAGMTELIRSALYEAYHKIENLSADSSRPQEIYCIGGPICESSDVFAHQLEFPHTERGDVVSLRSAGAYGAVMSSHYNLRPSAPTHYNR